MKQRLILDLSRTLSRAAHPVPTGIDRVEMAYAESLMARADDRLQFAAMHPLGRFGHLPGRGARHFVDMTARRWRGAAVGIEVGAGADHDAEEIRRAARRLSHGILLRAGLPNPARLLRRWGRDSAYLLMSHHHLDRPTVIEGVMGRDRAAFVCLVHDLIPMEYPEYARPAEPARHQRRIETVARLADAIVVNSAATGRSLQPWLDRAGRRPPVLVAPLGIDPIPDADRAIEAPPDEPPYFVFVGTVEPRKNHLLALHLWRRLAEQHGPAAPRLVLVGRRGWENEQVVDLLERCESLRGLVTEHGDLSDAQTRALLARSRALILPSFAEGYGLPVAEALAQGVPVLCSDLPALREVGREVPDYLDPLDGLGWHRAIEEYAAPDSPRRAAQLVRLRGWRPPSWDGHMDAVMDLLDGLARSVAA